METQNYKKQIESIYSMFVEHIDEIDYLFFIDERIESLNPYKLSYSLYESEKDNIIEHIGELIDRIDFLENNKKYLSETRLNILSYYIKQISILQKKFEFKLFENEILFPKLK